MPSPGDDTPAEAHDSKRVSMIAEPMLRVALGSREQLLADLQEAMRPGAVRSALVIVGLTGFQEYVDRHGWLEGEVLLDALATRLDEAVAGSSSCYRARRDEFALLCDPERAPLAPLLQRVTAAVAEPDGSIPVGAAYGTVVVPDETSDPLAALQLADERLTGAQPGRQPRERRRYLRPGSRDDRAGRGAPPRRSSSRPSWRAPPASGGSNGCSTSRRRSASSRTRPASTMPARAASRARQPAPTGFRSSSRSSP